MRVNTTKQKLLEGKATLGAIACLGSPLSAELLAMAGPDYVIVDDQHGIWEPESMMAAFRSIQLVGATPMARVGQNDFYAIGAMLDRGALGIIIPMVHTPEEAQAAVLASRYPPLGGRSMGPYGCQLYGADYLEWANDEILLMVQIESTQGLENVEQILAVEGIDGCWVGPGDLAASMGATRGSKEHEAAMIRILQACHKTNKIPGTYAHNKGQHRLDQGYLFITPADDMSFMRAGVQELLEKLKACGR